MIKQIFAQKPPATPEGIVNPLLQGATGHDIEAASDGSLFFSVLTGILQFMMVLGAIIVLINLLQAGIEWIGSGGDSTKLENARKRLTNAIIGIIILSASYAIWVVVTQNFLGINVSFGPLFP
ncbi:MAG: hypothetical protein ABIJ22_03395 [Patescibacteria group bacterium]